MASWGSDRAGLENLQDKRFHFDFVKVFITGADRGIGFAICKCSIEAKWRVLEQNLPLIEMEIVENLVAGQVSGAI